MAGEEFQARVEAVITDPTLSYAQRRHYLAALAENSLPYPPICACLASLTRMDKNYYSFFIR